MINNKIITITKNNQFDMGWTLFSPYVLNIDKNPKYVSPNITNLVKQITYATKVNIVLAEPCLSSRIIKELEWVSDYAEINIVAKSDEIIKKYTNLKFTSKKVDPTVSVSFIGVTGKNNGSYILNDEIVEVDGCMEEVLFEGKKTKTFEDFLVNASKLFVISSTKPGPFNKLIEVVNKRNIGIVLITNTETFDREVFDYAKEKKLSLLVSPKTTDAIVVLNQDNSLSLLSILSSGQIVAYPIERLSNYHGNLFSCLFIENRISTDKIGKDIYSCFGGENKKLDIQPKIVVEKEVHIKEMEDFINESFDSSIVEQHNVYSNRAISVEYVFTLVPPLMDSTFFQSSIYKGILELNSEWRATQTLKFEIISSEYNSFMSEECELIRFFKRTLRFDNTLYSMVNKCEYKGFYSTVRNALSSFKDYKNYLLDDCKFMFKLISDNNSLTRFDKFDAEIEGYRNTIIEKTKLIEEGVDVLSNKRRVEILNKKINDLLELKRHFEENSESRGNKNLDAFIDMCQKILAGEYVDGTSDDSIGKIVNNREVSKEVKLNSFISKYLPMINDYLTKCISIIEKLAKEDIPEEYPVIEKDNQRYIVISDLDEYESTKDIREKYSLKCLTRR